MRIGLVLAKEPGRDETFLRLKIQVLLNAGFEVVLIVGQRNLNKDKTDLNCKVISAPIIPSNKMFSALLWSLKVVWLFLLSPRRGLKFVKLERATGLSLRQIAEDLYLNSHILPLNLDWLHFSFATMVIRRENVAKAIGARMGISIRGYDICIYPLKHHNCYYLAWKKVNKIHTISSDLLLAARKEGLSTTVPVQKITPAININKFSSKNQFRNLSHPVQILTVARLHWKKGLNYTLEALAILYNKGFDFRYTIIGNGSEYERLCFAAYQLGLVDKIHFAGRQPHKEVKRAMEEADIYLQYSVQEGFCNAALEAQAMGLLCIVSDAEGLPENVLHGLTGWVVPKRRPELLARRIEAVLQMSAEEQERIRRQAVQRVRLEFNLEKQRRAFLSFYTK